jgi:hypothetical protein
LFFFAFFHAFKSHRPRNALRGPIRLLSPEHDFMKYSEERKKNVNKAINGAAGWCSSARGGIE